MKKWLCTIVVLVLSVFLFCLASAEENGSESANQERSKLALDMVIVIDESGTMSSQENSGNDLNGYRHDAAAALISLCDAQFSRVAIVPFSTTVIDGSIIPGVNELKNISMTEFAQNRQDFLRMLVKGDRTTEEPNLYTYSIKHGGQTDLGGALERAVEILAENRSENTPVIVLLSDGEISFVGPNKEERRKTSERKFKQALEKAVKMDIKLYTVALKLDSKLLRSAAAEADGMYFNIDEPVDLPVIFNQIFADLVGSDVVSLEGRTEDLGDGHYRATFNVPNLSIAEANILLPVGEYGSIRLFKPGIDQRVAFDGVKYSCNSTSFFTVVKILNPDKTGEWTIEYEQRNGLTSKQREALGSVSINVIYSYDVTPEITFAKEPLHKMETNKLSVFFQKNGVPAEDSMLYQGGIHAELTISDHEGNKLELNLPDGSTGTAMNLVSESDCFSAEIVPKNLIHDIHGGEYTFHVTTKGDGMDYGVTKTFTVENLAPQETGAGTNVFEDCEIHDPRRQDYKEEKKSVINLNEYVTEPDGEEILFAMMDPTGDSILDVIDLTDGLLTLQTKNTNGSATLKVRAYDAEGAETVLSIPCKVTSVRDQIRDNYSVVITSDGESVIKGEPYTYTAVLKNGTEEVTDEKLLNLLDFSLKLQKAYTIQGKDIETENLDFTRDGDVYRASAVSSMNECTYSVAGSVLLKDIELKTELPSFTLKNQSPALMEGDNPFAAVKIHDPTKENYAEEFKATIDLSTFVTDPDGEKPSFEIVSYGTPEVTTKKLDSDQAKLSLETIDLTGKETIQISATDPEGESVIIKIPVDIENVRNTIQEQYSIKAVLPDELQKDEDFDITAALMHDGKQIEDAKLLGIIDTSAMELVFVPSDGSQEIREAAGFSLENNVWKVQKHTGKKEGTYRIDGNASLQNGDIQLRAETEGGELGNKKPVIEEEYQAALQTRFEIEPFLWRKLNETTYEIDLNQLFTDSPRDEKIYGAYVLPAQMSEEEAALGADGWFDRKTELELEKLNVENNGRLVINNEKAGERSILLYDVDSDGQKACMIYRQTIISQKHEVIVLLLEILAAIVVLIILIIAWYWIVYRKAWNSKHGEVSITVNRVPRPGRTAFPKRGKHDANLNTLKITEVATGDMKTQLAAYAKGFKLRAGANGRVYVLKSKLKKEPFSMMIGTTPMNRNTKKAVWEPGVVMSIKTAGAGTTPGGIQIDIRRETNPAGGGFGRDVKMTAGTSTSKPAGTAVPNEIAKPKI